MEQKISQKSASKSKAKMQPQLKPVMDLMKQSWDVYVAKFKPLVLMSLIGILGVVAIWLVIGVYALLTHNNILSGTNLAAAHVALGVLGIIAILFSIYISVLAQISLVFIVADGAKHIRDYLQKARRFFWPVILVNAVVLGFLILWSLLFFIPGLVFAIFYMFALYVLLLEGYRSSNAVKRSRELVRGRWWSVFGRVAVVMIIYYVVFLVLSVPVFLFDNVVFVHTWELALNVVSIVISPFFVVYFYSLYKDLKKTEQGKSAVPQKPKSQYGTIVGVIVAILFIGGLIGSLLYGVFVFEDDVESSRMNSRDFKRAADIGQIGIALELYKLDAGVYPQGLFDETFLQIITEVPVNPTPNDGECPVDFQYEYKALEDGSDYELSFCLGEEVAEYNSGINVATSEDFALEGFDLDIEEVIDGVLGEGDEL